MKIKNIVMTSSLILATQPAFANSYICEACKAGTYSAGDGCKTCESGTYSQAASKECTSCSAGSWAPAGSSSCTSCLSTGVKTCDSKTGKATGCQAGYGFNASTKTCTACGTGTVSAGGTSACTPCGAGQQPNSTQSACLTCPAGTYNSPNGRGCSACPDYTWSSAGSKYCGDISIRLYRSHWDDNVFRSCPLGSWRRVFVGSSITCNWDMYISQDDVASLLGVANYGVSLINNHGKILVNYIAAQDGHCGPGCDHIWSNGSTINLTTCKKLPCEIVGSDGKRKIRLDPDGYVYSMHENEYSWRRTSVRVDWSYSIRESYSQDTEVHYNAPYRP